MNKTTLNVTVIGILFVLIFIFYQTTQQYIKMLIPLGHGMPGYDELMIKSLVSGLIGFVILLVGLKSLKLIRDNEVGAIYFIENAMCNVGPGLVMCPPFIFKLYKIVGTDIRERYPDDLPENMKKPIMVFHLSVNGNGDALDKRQSTEITVNVAYSIQDCIQLRKSFSKFEDLKRSFAATCLATIDEVCHKYTALQMKTNDTIIEQEAIAQINKKIKKWGAVLLELDLTANFKGVVIDAFERIPISMVDRDSEINRARTKAEVNWIEGESRAELIELFLMAESNGYKYMADSLGIKGEEVAKLKIIGDALRNSTLTLTQISTMAGGVGEIFTDLLARRRQN